MVRAINGSNPSQPITPQYQIGSISDYANRTLRGLGYVLLDMWYDIKWVFSSPAVASILSKHQVQLQQLEAGSSPERLRELKKQWGADLKTTAVNYAKASSMKKTQAYQQAADEIVALNKMPWVKNTQVKISDPVRSGVCAGATIDYGLRALKLAQKYPIDSPEFRAALVDEASRYTFGIGKAGVANQIAYEFLRDVGGQLGFVPDPHDPIKNLVNVAICNIRHNREWSEGLDSGQFSSLQEYLEFKTIFEKLYAECGRQKKLMHYEPAKLIEIVRREAGSDKVESYRALCVRLIQALTVQTRVNLAEEYDEQDALIQSVAEDHLQRTAEERSYVPYLKERYNRSDDALRVVARYRGLDVTGVEDILGSSHGRTDKSFLARLDQLPNGVYGCSFDTSANGISGHAVLFIKSGEYGYLWDPNAGLIECKNNSKERFLDLVQSRYHIDFNNRQHDIKIRQFTTRLS